MQKESSDYDNSVKIIVKTLLIFYAFSWFSAHSSSAPQGHKLVDLILVLAVTMLQEIFSIYSPWWED